MKIFCAESVVFVIMLGLASLFTIFKTWRSNEYIPQKGFIDPNSTDHSCG